MNITRNKRILASFVFLGKTFCLRRNKNPEQLKTNEHAAIQVEDNINTQFEIHTCWWKRIDRFVLQYLNIQQFVNSIQSLKLYLRHITKMMFQCLKFQELGSRMVPGEYTRVEKLLQSSRLSYSMSKPFTWNPIYNRISILSQGLPEEQ